MKKILMLFICVLIGMIGMAQSTAKTGTWKIGAWTPFAGTATTDSLQASLTNVYTLNLAKYAVDQGVNVQLWVDRISGAPTFAVKCYWSNDGTNIPATAANATDSASVAHGTSDYVFMHNFDTAAGKYLIIKVIPTSATQLSKVYGWANCYTK